MSATEILRRMLDERGVEWEGSERSIRWRDRNGIMMQAFPLADGELGLEVWSCTPAQAVTATLGREECHITDNGPWGYPYVCSECGASFDPDVNNGEFNYCPNCGRKVVDE